MNYPYLVFETGPVKSKSNFRRSATSKWSDVSAFESEVGILARQSRPAEWVVDDQEKLADRPVVVAVISAVTMLDAGNLSKSILDGAEGVLYRNDASVVLVMEHAERSKSGQKAVIAFAQLPAGSSKEELAQVAAELFSVVSTY